eukprot:gene36177-33789_t
MRGPAVVVLLCALYCGAPHRAAVRGVRRWVEPDPAADMDAWAVPVPELASVAGRAAAPSRLPPAAALEHEDAAVGFVRCG